MNNNAEMHSTNNSNPGNKFEINVKVGAYTDPLFISRGVVP